MICFVINVFDESIESLISVISNINKFYHNSKIIIIYDGGVSYNISGVVSIRESHTKTRDCGGLWSHRYLKCAIDVFPEASHIIKIDPDTRVVGTAKALPEIGIFGAFKRFKVGKLDISIPHGGAIGYTNNIASSIVKNEWMLDTKFVNSYRYNACNDIMMADVIKNHNIPTIHRPDFFVWCFI